MTLCLTHCYQTWMSSACIIYRCIWITEMRQLIKNQCEKLKVCYYANTHVCMFESVVGWGVGLCLSVCVHIGQKKYPKKKRNSVRFITGCIFYLCNNVCTFRSNAYKVFVFNVIKTYFRHVVLWQIVVIYTNTALWTSYHLLFVHFLNPWFTLCLWQSMQSCYINEKAWNWRSFFFLNMWEGGEK